MGVNEIYSLQVAQQALGEYLLRVNTHGFDVWQHQTWMETLEFLIAHHDRMPMGLTEAVLALISDNRTPTSLLVHVKAPHEVYEIAALSQKIPCWPDFHSEQIAANIPHYFEKTTELTGVRCLEGADSKHIVLCHPDPFLLRQAQSFLSREPDCPFLISIFCIPTLTVGF